MDSRKEVVTDHLTDEALAAFLDNTMAIEAYSSTVLHLHKCNECYRRYCDASRLLLSIIEAGKEDD